MNPTPGKTGWPGPSSSATNTPNGSIDAIVPVMRSPGCNDARNAHSSACSVAAVDRKTLAPSTSTDSTRAVIRCPGSTSGRRIQDVSSGPTVPSGRPGKPSSVTLTSRWVTSAAVPSQTSPTRTPARNSLQAA